MPNKGETKTVNGVTGQWDGQTWRRVSTQDQADVDRNVGTVLGENYHPGANDTPLTAAFGELARTGKAAGAGFLKGVVDLPSLLAPILHPGDTLEGAMGAAKHPVDALTNAVGSMVADPEVGGHALGQVALGERLPGLAKMAVSKGPAALGRGAAAIGRGMEAAGESAAMRATGRFGPGAVLLHPSPAGAAVSVGALTVPPALRGLGRVLQKFGPEAEAADLGAASGTGVPHGAQVPASLYLEDLKKLSPTDQLAELSARKAARAAGKVDEAAPAVDNPRAPSSEIPYRMGEPSGVEGLNERPAGPREGPKTFADSVRAEAERIRRDEAVTPGNLKFNDASQMSENGFGGLNSLMEKTGDFAPGEASAQVSAPVSPQAQAVLDGLKRRSVVSDESMAPADVEAASPLDKLARLSQMRERARSFRTNTPLAEAF